MQLDAQMLNWDAHEGRAMQFHENVPHRDEQSHEKVIWGSSLRYSRRSLEIHWHIWWGKLIHRSLSSGWMSLHSRHIVAPPHESFCPSHRTISTFCKDWLENQNFSLIKLIHKLLREKPLILSEKKQDLYFSFPLWSYFRKWGYVELTSKKQLNPLSRNGDIPMKRWAYFF